MKNKISCLYMFVFAISLSTISCSDIGTRTGETILEPIQPVLVSSAPTHAIGGSSEQKLAQTFTISYNGTLTGVFLPLNCSSGELNVEIRDITGDDPGTSVLSNQSFNADSIVTNVTVFKFFSLPDLAVSNGDRLTLVVTNSSGTCGMSSGPIGDSYPDGEGFYDARPNAPGWVRFADFDSTAQDLVFQVLIEGI